MPLCATTLCKVNQFERHITTLKTTYHQLSSLDAIATSWGSIILQAVVAARLEKELFLDVFALSTS